jgi:hypothetical protein
MNGYSATLAICSSSIILLLLYVLHKDRSISFAAEGQWIACGLLILFILMPFRVAGSAYDDTRIATAALLILPSMGGFGGGTGDGWAPCKTRRASGQPVSAEHGARFAPP